MLWKLNLRVILYRLYIEHIFLNYIGFFSRKGSYTIKEQNEQLCNQEPPIIFRGIILNKETTLERADFALQLSMFVTAEKEREMFIIFFLSSFCQLLSPRF